MSFNIVDELWQVGFDGLPDPPLDEERVRADRRRYLRALVRIANAPGVDAVAIAREALSRFNDDGTPKDDAA